MRTVVWKTEHFHRWLRVSSLIYVAILFVFYTAWRAAANLPEHTSPVVREQGPTDRHRNLLTDPRILHLLSGVSRYRQLDSSEVVTPARLEHNLTATDDLQLRGIYLQQLSQVQNSSGLQWVEPDSRKQFCNCIDQETPQVALVGNGPLSQEQERRINAATCIVRFNQLNNRRGPGRTDLWIVRLDFFPELQVAQEVARGVQAIVLAADPAIMLAGSAANASGSGISELSGGSQGFKAPITPFSGDSTMENLASQAWVRALAAAAAAVGLSEQEAVGKILALETTGFLEAWKRFVRRLGYKKGWRDPSSGLLGLLLLLDCLPPGGTIDLYGFNWSPENWKGHQMGVERSLVEMLTLARGGRLRVNPTPCAGLRFCKG